MVYQSQLQRNTGVIDPLIYSDSIADSYFNYTGYRCSKNFYKFYKDIAPDKSGIALGGKSEFRLPSMADKLGKVWLQFSLEAPTNSGGAPTHDLRFVDWVGCHAFSSVQLEYGSNEVYTIFPDEIVLRAKQSLDIADQDRIRELLAGDRTESRRENLAGGTQDFICPLPFPWCRSTDRHMELLQKAVEPRIIVNWRTPSQIIQGDGATGLDAVLSDVSLRCQLTHLEGDERDDNTSRLEHPDGILRLYEDLKYEKFTRELKTGTVGNADISIKLNNFRSSTKSLLFVLRKLAEVNPGAGQEPNYTNYQRISQFYLEATDGKFFEPVEDKFNRFVQWEEWHKAPSGPKIYEWSWAMEPDDLLNASGGINLGSASNLTLKIQVPADLVGDHELTVIAKEYNFTQDSRGDMMKIFR